MARSMIAVLVIIVLLSSCRIHIATEPTYHMRDIEVVIRDGIGNTIAVDEESYRIDGSTVDLSVDADGCSILWFIDGMEISPERNGDGSYTIAALEPGTHSIAIILIGEGDAEIASISFMLTAEGGDTEIIEGDKV